MDSYIRAFDKGLKLCRTPPNILKAFHVAIVKRLDDRANAAYGFVDDSLMACAKGFYKLRIIGNQRFRDFKTEAADELRLEWL
jgi:hypothetical protein